ncbi:hypothetical protein DL96DRAFT_1500410 [Flagelloscypha sp. PMI_526]|nr:hypothetical protein DL96DRAFT_1500410 [Flagelloscypha sp. PMI_526]
MASPLSVPSHNPRKPYPFGFKQPSSQLRPALREIRNENLRRILSDDLSPPANPEVERRTVSQPAPRKNEGSRFLVSSLNKRPCFRPASLNSRRPLTLDQSLKRCPPPPPAKLNEKNNTNPILPIAPVNSQLTALHTRMLKPTTHKSASGCITILPHTLALLVDFREAERRRGGTGREVIVISSDGLHIEVYDAPHLSTPCCLLEPTTKYLLVDLPHDYHRWYRDATRLVDQIRERTPRLVMYIDKSKCILMANEPQGHIEIVSDVIDFTPSSRPSQDKSQTFRTRLERGPSPTLEFTRHRSGKSRSTQTYQRTVPITKDSLDKDIYEELVPTAESLNSQERLELQILSRFLRICRAIDDLVTRDGRNDSYAQRMSSEVMDGHSGPSARSFGAHSLKTSYPELPVEGNLGVISPVNIIFAPRPNIPQPLFNLLKIYLESILKQSGKGIQTRFKDNIGWCIRTGSTETNGGRYKIMFVDGVALEVDADEEWVEFMDEGGQLSRLDIQECAMHKKIGSRLRAFAGFVSMFDD